MEAEKSKQKHVSDGSSKHGEPKLRKTIEEKIGKTFETYLLEHLPTCSSEHFGVQPQKQTGYSYINIPIVSGVLSSEKIFSFAQIAEEFGNGELRLTPFQNIILSNIPNKSVNQALKSLEKQSYPATNPYLKWTTIACAGNFCGKTVDHPKKRAAETIDYLEKRFGEKLKKVKLSIGFSGCPNGCGRHLIADVGLQGTAVASEGKSMPVYNMYVRENKTVSPLLGKLTQKGIKAEDVKFVLASYVENELKNKKTSHN